MPTGRLTEEMLNDPIHRHARTDFSTLQPNWTINQALEHLRNSPPGGRVIYFYVCDAENKLVGVVPTRRLVLNPPESLVSSIMVKSTIAVPNEATVLEALEFFSLHRLLALPLVDEDRKLVGVVDVDLYTDELTETSDESPHVLRDDIFQIIGVHLTQAQVAQPWRAFRGRFPWLLCNVAGGLLAAILSGIYQDVLEWRHAVLALFVPIVLALAESVTIQSVTLTLEGLRAEKLSLGKLLKRCLNEARTGFLLGLGTAILVGLVALGWQQDIRVASILSGAILGGVTMAAFVGVAVPLTLRYLKRDPQVAAGPVCLALADFAALLLYFNLGRLAAG
ncbi:magnesium transporter [soil metagenome]